MADPVKRINDENLEKSLLHIRELNGSKALSRDLQDVIPGFKTQKGIYKPQNSQYALWIRQTSRGPYDDKDPDILPDGSWYYRYTPEARGGETDLSLNTNRALLNSMDDNVPLGVFIQRDLPGSQRTYEVMGLAYVEAFDGTHFIIHGEPIDVEAKPMKVKLISPFRPYETGELPVSETTKVIRERAFQAGIRRLYHEKCSLCELGYHFHGQPIGVEAAHLIPVSDRGTSKDLRNGILLCRNHHSLFDRYIWTLDEDYRVLVKDEPLFRRSAESNHVLKVEGLKLPNLPDNEYDLPPQEAIDFRLGRFNNPRL